MPDPHDRIIDELMEQLVEQGPGGMAAVFTRLFNLAMRFERENYLSARHYERTDERRGYANGIKPKRIDTAAGTLVVDVPKTAGTDEPFYPRSLERGTRSSRALMLAVAEMYVKGVSTRDVADILDKFGIDGLSSSQVSRASKLLDHDLEQWRERPLGEVRYLILDARYEKVRIDGIVRDATILSAIGIGPDSRRSLLGVSVALSEAEVHWRAFLDNMVRRGLRGVQFITSDDHAGLGAARRAVFGGVTWQRCQFHLAQNAIVSIRRRPPCAPDGGPLILTAHVRVPQRSGGVGRHGDHHRYRASPSLATGREAADCRGDGSAWCLLRRSCQAPRCQPRSAVELAPSGATWRTGSISDASVLAGTCDGRIHARPACSQ